jgi:hypothetical protein
LTSAAASRTVTWIAEAEDAFVGYKTRAARVEKRLTDDEESDVRYKGDHMPGEEVRSAKFERSTCQIAR